MFSDFLFGNVLGGQTPYLSDISSQNLRDESLGREQIKIAISMKLELERNEKSHFIYQKYEIRL